MPKEQEWSHHRGKFLMTAGLVLLLIGVLQYYNVTWPVTLMVIGVVLMLKGLWVKSMKK